MATRYDPTTTITVGPDGIEWGVAFETDTETDDVTLRVRRWDNGRIAHHPADHKPFADRDAAWRRLTRTHGMHPKECPR